MNGYGCKSEKLKEANWVFFFYIYILDPSILWALQSN